MKTSGKFLTLLATFLCLALTNSPTLAALGAAKPNGGIHGDRGDRDRDDGHKNKHEKRCEDRDRDDRDEDREAGDHDFDKDRDHSGDRGRRHRDDDDDDCECRVVSPSVLALKAPGVSLENPNLLLSAFLIANTGHKTKKDVKITSITLPGGTLKVPASLPDDLGTLASKASAKVDADFFGGPFLPSTSYPLTITGTYVVEHETHCFKLKATLTVPPAAPGSAPLKTTTVGPNTVTGAPFPHQPLNFDGDVNTAGWTVPTGPFVPGVPTATVTSPQKAPLGDPPAIDFFVNNSLGLTSGGFNGQSANGGSVEPSGGASGGGVVSSSVRNRSREAGSPSTSMRTVPVSFFTKPPRPRRWARRKTKGRNPTP